MGSTLSLAQTRTGWTSWLSTASRCAGSWARNEISQEAAFRVYDFFFLFCDFFFLHDLLRQRWVKNRERWQPLFSSWCVGREMACLSTTQQLFTSALSILPTQMKLDSLSLTHKKTENKTTKHHLPKTSDTGQAGSQDQQRRPNVPQLHE